MKIIKYWKKRKIYATTTNTLLIPRIFTADKTLHTTLAFSILIILYHWSFDFQNERLDLKHRKVRLFLCTIELPNMILDVTKLTLRNHDSFSGATVEARYRNSISNNINQMRRIPLGPPIQNAPNAPSEF